MSTTKRVVMLRGTVGEDGSDWPIGEERQASPSFARWLVDRKKARYAPAPAAAARAEAEADPTEETGADSAEGPPTPRRGRGRKGQ